MGSNGYVNKGRWTFILDPNSNKIRLLQRHLLKITKTVFKPIPIYFLKKKTNFKLNLNAEPDLFP